MSGRDLIPSKRRDDRFELTEMVYELLLALPRNASATALSSLPENGIYVFFERSETIELSGHVVDRIVRVGTHRSDGRFRGRIRQHYGNRSSLRGNKNSSVFRKHVGGAIIRRDNPDDDRLHDWLTQDAPTDLDIEERVSRYFAENFTFACFAMEDKRERLAVESQLIALLAQRPMGRPSPRWLGHYAQSEIIRRTGLWNTQHVDGTPVNVARATSLSQIIRH